MSGARRARPSGGAKAEAALAPAPVAGSTATTAPWSGIEAGPSLVAGAGLLVAAAGGLALAVEARLPFMGKAVAAYGVMALLVVWLGRLRRKGAPFYLADRLTLLRAVAVALLAAFIGGPQGGATAWGVAALAAGALALDGLDGLVARRRGECTPFGARFDHEVDTLFLLVLAALAWSWGRAGPWILAAGLLRYAFVAAGRLWPALARPLPPSRRRRLAFAVQGAALVGCLTPVLPPPGPALLAGAGLAALAGSFAVDIARLARRAGPPSGAPDLLESGPARR